MVKLRTDTINHVRGTVKAVGHRLPRCSAEAFAKVAAAHVPDALRTAVLPLLDLIATFTTQIRMYDRQVAQLIRDQYPIAEHLQQPRGVELRALCSPSLANFLRYTWKSDPTSGFSLARGSAR